MYVEGRWGNSGGPFLGNERPGRAQLLDSSVATENYRAANVLHLLVIEAHRHSVIPRIL
jgi:hypothetical protein